MCINKNPDSRAKLHGMKDQELITYCESVHISMDSPELIDELVYRLKFYKEVNSDPVAEKN